MFYGVITQSDWLQIFRDYPELKEMTSNHLIEEKAYDILWTTMRENPLSSIKGIINEWRKLFFDQWYSIFFMERINQLELSLRILASIGLIKCFFLFKKPINLLIILYGTGVFLSVPFLAGSFRTYAATIAVIPLFSAIGLSVILEKVFVPLFQYLLELVKKRRVFSTNINFQIPSSLRDNFEPKSD